MPRPAPSRARRIVMPLIILVIGGAIAWWAAQRETTETAAVRRYVQEICLAAGAGEDVKSRLIVEPRALRAPLARMMEIACEPLRENPDGLEIDITTEAAGAIDRNRPMHEARIQVLDVHVLTLHLVVVNERPIITGYKDPQRPG